MRALSLLSIVLLVGCSSAAAPQPQDGGDPDGSPPPIQKKDGGGNTFSDAGSDGGPFVCSPAAKPGELYELSARNLANTRDVSMCEYRGQVLLIVNVASQCAYTPQYAPLQTIYEKYLPKGFAVLGFPCNQFGAQEPGTPMDITTFCTQMYGITFPMFGKSNVNGASTNPIYTWLKAQPGGAGDITWNFNKFLIGRDGKLIKRYDSAVTPDSAQLTADIEAALAK
jgi:glutathione peroxidase